MGPAAQVETVELEQSQAGHHAVDRRQVQEVMEAHRGDDGNQEQADDGQAAPLEYGITLQVPRWGLTRRQGEVHDQGGHDEIHHRRDKQLEKGAKLENAFLPDHQGGDVAKGTESATGVGGNHDIDAAQADKGGLALSHRKNDSAHDQRGGQVVRHRGNEECQDAGDPEQ